MNSARWGQIKETFAAVVDMPPSERPSALAELCQNDLELKSEVERLLTQHDDMGGFLESSSPPGRGIFAGQRFADGEIVAGRYRITEFLGEGGMGAVYAAEDQELGEQIAIKIIRQGTPFGSNMLERLRREVQLARRVTHPNVCRVFDLGRQEQQGHDVIFLTMELIHGETLATRLQREGKISPPEALLIATQLCEALDAAHQVGVLHRDFKTSNVMLAGQGEHVRVVITDFGIARLMSGTKDSSAASVTQGGVVGTPAYMSPEQLLEKQLTIASDIYSLGLVLYEMVTGSRPFQGLSSWTETLKRLSDPPRPPVEIVRDLDPRWNSAILRCLQRDPANRFPSARAVARFLSGKGRISLVLQSWRFQVAAACCILAIAATGFVLRDRIWFSPLPKEKHVAVLPFTFKGNDQANQARAYELAESLTTNLSRLEADDGSLWVAPWDHVNDKKPEDAADVASALGVNLLVIGELQETGGMLHLFTELKDAKSLKLLRSRTVEIQETQIVTLEDKLLDQASYMLQLHIPAETRHHLPVDATVEPSAYVFYEQGRGYLLHASPGTPEDLDLAIALLHKATEKDPTFALAYANLAYAYATKFQNTRDSQWIEKAKPACERALALNDGLAPAHLALGLIEQYTGNQDGAIRELEKALQLDPRDGEIITRLSNAYESAGRLFQAEALLKDAIKRTPGNWVNYNNLGALYFRHAEYAQAEPFFRTTTELAPDNPLAFYNLGGVYLALGKYQEAETILTKGIALGPNAGAYSNLGTARQYQGRYGDAVAMFQKAVELRSEDHRLWCNLATAYKLAGNSFQAVEAFRTALQLTQKSVALHVKDDPQTLGSLARYYAELGEKRKALEALAQASASSKNDQEFLFDSLLVYELNGDRDRALAALGDALRAGYSLSEIEHVPELVALRRDQRYPGIARNFTP